MSLLRYATKRVVSTTLPASSLSGSVLSASALSHKSIHTSRVSLLETKSDKGPTSDKPHKLGEIDLPPTDGIEKDPEHVIQVADMICKFSLIDMAKLGRLLQKKLGVPDYVIFGGGGGGGGAPVATTSAAPTTAAADAKSAAPVAAEKKEKTEFDVKIQSFDEKNKIKIIKEIRTLLPALQLKQAKDLVESAPVVVKKGASKAEADKFKKTLEEAGAKVDLE